MDTHKRGRKKEACTHFLHIPDLITASMHAVILGCLVPAMFIISSSACTRPAFLLWLCRSPSLHPLPPPSPTLTRLRWGSQSQPWPANSTSDHRPHPSLAHRLYKHRPNRRRPHRCAAPPLSPPPPSGLPTTAPLF